jgi:hypothetical protein
MAGKKQVAPLTASPAATQAFDAVVLSVPHMIPTPLTVCVIEFKEAQVPTAPMVTLDPATLQIWKL